MKKKLVVFSGAGVSAESGVPTFRDSDGLWENHKMEDVATPAGWEKNRELVLNFYNLMRTKLKMVIPNKAHEIIAELEEHFDVTVITQNIDDLHERGGSKNVIHLHGELLKSRSTVNPNLKYECTGNINVGDKCEKGSQLRPDIVWFGENVYHLDRAAGIVEECDVLLVVGTSLNVWPAAGLIHVVKEGAEIYCIDPKLVTDDDRIIHIKKKAGEGMEKFKKIILEKKDKKENCCL
jgi:NAD-dependent deacetylase